MCWYGIQTTANTLIAINICFEKKRSSCLFSYLWNTDFLDMFCELYAFNGQLVSPSLLQDSCGTVSHPSWILFWSSNVEKWETGKKCDALLGVIKTFHTSVIRYDDYYYSCERNVVLLILHHFYNWGVKCWLCVYLYFSWKTSNLDRIFFQLESLKTNFCLYYFNFPHLPILTFLCVHREPVLRNNTRRQQTTK